MKRIFWPAHRDSNKTDMFSSLQLETNCSMNLSPAPRNAKTRLIATNAMTQRKEVLKVGWLVCTSHKPTETNVVHC